MGGDAVKLLHFADAHIDMANYGRLDAKTRLPLRVLDFLRSLDEIVQAAIDEKVDAVLFAGDAYKDRSPSPTYQREWGKRIARLAQAGVPVFLLVGNHDTSPAQGRAHALHEFATLGVPNVHVLDRPALLGPQETGLPLQLIALPWLSRAAMVAALDLRDLPREKVLEQLEARLDALVQDFIAQADPNLPLVLMAHASVQGAVYGGERMVMLGRDLTLSGSLVKDPRLDYVALGHIHKPQNLTADEKQERSDPPPVVYPGSIERVDFGEAGEKKYYVLAEVEPGRAKVTWRELRRVRPFRSFSVRLTGEEAQVTERLQQALGPAEDLREAIVRLTVTYPAEMDARLDEAALRRYAAEAFEFQLVRRPQQAARLRLPEGQGVAEIAPLELLRLYLQSQAAAEDEIEALLDLAADLLAEGEEAEAA